jgi:hypothetical protein
MMFWKGRKEMRRSSKRVGKSAISLTVAVALVMTMASAGASFAIAEPSGVFAEFTKQSDTSKYPKPDFSTITGEGGNPPELNAEASSLGAEKQWYEYITYSEKPVGHFDLSATQRVLYYDPYDYNSALVMRVKNSMTNWSTANEVSFTYETVQAHVVRIGTTNETQTVTGYDETTGGSSTITASASHETTKGWMTEENRENGYSDGWERGGISEDGFDWGLSETVHGETDTTLTLPLIGTETIEIGLDVGSNQQWHSNKQTYNLSNHIDSESIRISAGENASDTWNDSIGNTDESSWSIAKRFEKATGVSTTNDNDWSTSSGKSVTTVYLAQYFNEEGSPLSWKIVQYAVFMPLRYELQTKVGTEWLTVYNGYSLITPVQGTCRAYMRNNVAYIEDYGTGLPVAWSDFWSGFFTTESLKAAYENKLYPDNN